jgi:hypothetical protein
MPTRTRKHPEAAPALPVPTVSDLALAALRHAPPTFTAYETLPDGAECVVVVSVRYSVMLTVAPEWADVPVVWRQDDAED